MSITSARNFIEKSGCGLIVGIGLAVVIGASLVQTGTCGNSEPQNQPEQITPIAKINDGIVSLNAVEQRYNQAAAQALNTEGGAPPERIAEVYASALEIELRMIAQREIARKQGVQVTAQRIIDQAAKQFDDQVAQQRAILTQLGQIKANATESEVQAALSTAFGVTDLAKARADVLKQVEANIQNPATRQQMEAEATGPLLIDAVAAKTELSDDQLKKDLVKTVTKRIALYPFEHPDEDLNAKAEKILAEIKGGLSFEAAMDKYSDDPAPADKKKKSESTVDLTRAVMTYDDSYKPLLDLKPGDVSPVIQLNTGPAIFKIVRVDPKLPDNFEATKGDLKKNRIREIAVKQIQADIENLLKSESLKWESQGFRVLHDWLKAHRDPELAKDKAKLAAKMEEIAKDAEAVLLAGDAFGTRAAQYAAFVALDKVYDDASATEKKALHERWLTAANGVLESTENIGLRLEIAELHFANSDAKSAADALVIASQSNAGYGESALENFKKIEALRAKLATATIEDKQKEDLKTAQDSWKLSAADDLKLKAEFNEDYSETGRSVYAGIAKTLSTYRALGIVSEDVVKEIEVFQARWRTEKIKADEEAAKEAARQKAEQKKAEEDAKKAAAETKTGDTKAGETKTGESKLPSSGDLLNPPKSGG